LKTEKKNTQLLLVLVPHRDVRFVLRKYSAGLFNAGFPGAFQFPWVVPVASLSKRLSSDELKHCARACRETFVKEKFTAMHGATVEFSDGASLFGPRLEQNIPLDAFSESAALKIKSLFSPQVIGSCFLWEQTKTPPLPPQLSFRAAAFANMICQPVQIETDGAAGFIWKIEKLSWLPAFRL